MDLLEQAKKALEAEGVTFAAVSSCGEKKTSQKKGIAPMMEILAECPDFLQGAAVEMCIRDRGYSNLLAKDVTFIRAELDYEDGRWVYDVEFYTDNKEYDFEIDATTGKVLDVDYDVDGWTRPETTKDLSLIHI